MATESKEVLVAATSAVIKYDGRNVAIKKGVTTVRRGHPILRGRMDMFKPQSVTFDLPVRAKS